MLMKAALMSPSGHRYNPWEFVLVEDKEVLKALSVSKEHGAGLLEGAAMAIAVVADTTKTDVWIEDCSIATIIIQLAAEELGLAVCFRISGKISGNLFHKLESHILMRHLTTAQSQSHFKAELLLDKVDRPVDLGLIIVLVDIDMKLDLFQFLSDGVLALCFLILFLLVEQFAEIHDPHHRRI